MVPALQVKYLFFTKSEWQRGSLYSIIASNDKKKKTELQAVLSKLYYFNKKFVDISIIKDAIPVQ